MTTFAGALLLAVLSLPQAGGVAQTTPAAELCPKDGTPATVPAWSAYCTDLIAVPTLRGASGILELRGLPTPFDVSVTRDGHYLYELTARVEGLPAPESLGDYTVYVAWATTLLLGDPVRLGVVTNGAVLLGTLAYDQFRVLISAEPNAEVPERTGPLVLRGTSPSAQAQQHQDALMFPPAAMDHSATGWRAPPMAPASPMMPGLMGLVPTAEPFLPGLETDRGPVPAVETTGSVTLADGDTLRLEAAPVRGNLRGLDLGLYGFNGQSPGPVLRVEQGSEIVVAFTNSTALSTTLRWHGVRLENRFDGVPGLTQRPVRPGDTYTARVRFPDPGVYWYHPHQRGDVAQDLGLYGAILVEPEDDEYYGDVNREEVLVLDDLLIVAQGLIPWGLETPTHALMGRFGTEIVVNGRADHEVSIDAGDVVRFFLVNASNTRIFNLAMGGAPLKIVAGDLGRFEREEWVESVVIAPGQRYVVEGRFDEPGDVAITNRVSALNHYAGVFYSKVDTLGVVRVGTEPVARDHSRSFSRLRESDAVVDDIDRFRPYFDKPVDHSLELRLVVQDLAPVLDMAIRSSTYSPPMEWNDAMPVMNWLTTGLSLRWVLHEPEAAAERADVEAAAGDEVEGPADAEEIGPAVGWRFTQGDVVKLRLVNPGSGVHPMNHPMHLHGQRFLVVERDGVRTTNLVWKDTTVIPVGSTVDLLVDMSNPGNWMLNCQIPEHMGSGMSITFTVDPAP
jgi:FtsP/CotA-like multicopper oxidase with cupredoxin domain